MRRRGESRAPTRRPLAVSLGALLALLGFVGPGIGAGGCVIPERTYDPSLDVDVVSQLPAGARDAGPPDAGQGSLCETYCTTVMAPNKCRDSAAVYESPAQCLAVCAQLPAGNLGDESGNSVSCRLSQLEKAGFEANDCAKVGPVSVDGTCGDACEAFCSLQSVACSGGEAYCESACPVLKKPAAYRLIDFASTDTLQCRLGHLARALETPGNAAECGNAQIMPASPSAPCRDSLEVSVEDDRDYYCALVNRSCQGSDALYDTVEQCRAVSESFERGAPDDSDNDTLRCRIYHSYLSLGAEKAMHCRHAGPTGDGRCADPDAPQEGNCVSYCRLLSQGCPNAFAELEAGAPSPPGGCMAECTALADATAGAFGTIAPLYSVNADLPGGSLKCRTLHAVRAVQNPAECDAAIAAPGSACALPPDEGANLQ